MSEVFVGRSFRPRSVHERSVYFAKWPLRSDRLRSGYWANVPLFEKFALAKMLGGPNVCHILVQYNYKILLGDFFGVWKWEKNKNFILSLKKWKPPMKIPQMHTPFVQICIIIASFQSTCLFFSNQPAFPHSPSTDVYIYCVWFGRFDSDQSSIKAHLGVMAFGEKTSSSAATAAAVAKPFLAQKNFSCTNFFISSFKLFCFSVFLSHL